MAPPDRLQALLAQNRLTGVDFVFVEPATQQDLHIHFLVPPASLVDQSNAPDPLTNGLGPESVLIDSLSETSALPSVQVVSTQWIVEDGQDVLHVVTAAPGDFSRYRLRLVDPRVDPFFNDVPFSFKAGCDTGLDCAPEPHACPPEPAVDFPVDYLARDFWSFRQALLDFASQRWPDYKDRLEADVGVMLAEVMSAVGDEMAYYQDRVQREAFLETASQRRSVRRHARLVDYEIHDGLAAWTWLDLTVTASPALIPHGTAVWALSSRGDRIDYEVGLGLSDPASHYLVKSEWSSFAPHVWDESATCLPVGATEVFIEGHWASDLLPIPGAFKWMLLRTTPPLAALPGQLPVPPRVHLVKVIAAEDREDSLLGQQVTRLVWEEAQALPFEIDLEILEMRGNLVPATAGKTYPAPGGPPILFTIGPSVDPAAPSAVERTGPNGSTAYLYSLLGSESAGLCWTGDAPRSATPEIRLEELDPLDDTNVVAEWQWRRSLLGSPSSLPSDAHFTLEDGVFRQVVSYWRGGAEPVRHIDYRSGDGFTIRFGDGELGRVPPATKFRVTYRLGNGRAGNVAEGALVHIDFPGVTVTNPLPVTSGVDPETLDDVRHLAPQEYRAVTFRAVRPEDYAEAAERLSWVQRAGATFRWTGSWLSAFVTPDPEGAVTLASGRRAELEDQLERFRQAGRETHVLDPVFAWLDLEVTVCVEAGAEWGAVKERVLAALSASGGFFDPDRFTFGVPLRRAALEAAIQRVSGVRAVRSLRIRRRGWFDWKELGDTTSALEVGLNEVIGIENDPLHPERGSVALLQEGAA